MARSRQRRKQRQQDKAINADAPANGGVAPELHDEADAPVAEDPGDGKPGITAADVSMSEEAREEFDRGLDEQVGAEDDLDEVSAAELIGAIGPLRRTRRHPLLAGIRMFTAMLEEARGGYAADRLEQMEEALALDFTGREQEGILQVSMAAMDETGVPDVEHGVQTALEARAQVEGEDVAQDHGDEQDRIDEVREAEAAERADADAAAEQEEDFTPPADEEEHDAPGPDEQ